MYPIISNCVLTKKTILSYEDEKNNKGTFMGLGKFYGVGIGSGNPEFLTIKAYNTLKEADTIFTVISKNSCDSVSQNVVEYVKPKGKVELLTFSMAKDKAVRERQVMDNTDKILAELEQGKTVAFATLGDAMTYSTFGYIFAIIKEKHPDLEIEIIPGVNSFTTLASISKTILVENRESLHVIPSFKEEDVENTVFPENSTTILLKTYRSRKALINRLKKEKEQFPNIQITYGEHLGLEGQKLAYSLEEIENIPETYLSMIMVKK